MVIGYLDPWGRASMIEDGEFTGCPIGLAMLKHPLKQDHRVLLCWNCLGFHEGSSNS